MHIPFRPDPQDPSETLCFTSLFVCLFQASGKDNLSSVHPPISGNRREKGDFIMNKYTSEKTSDKKYYVLFETDEEGIRQYKAASEQERIGTSLSKMRVEGEIVPAIKLEVDKSTYDTFKRDQWMEEYRYKQENRCLIGGAGGKSRFCPCRIPNPEYKEGGTAPKTIMNDCAKCKYYRSFKSTKGKVFFSTLTVIDDHGNEAPFDPASPYPLNQADNYMELLYGLIRFIKVQHPKYSKYTELVELLGHEHTLKEASVILGKPYRTLYGWILTLRPIFDEYMDTVSRI